MTPRLLLTSASAALCLLGMPLSAQTPSWGRETVHYKVDPRTKKEVKTGSTENISDPGKNMLTQITRSAGGVEMMRREFVLDSKGRVRSGAMWDGQKNLKGRTLYGFDSYDRVNEERLFWPNGRLIRQLKFKYDAQSRRLVDRCFMWNPKDPYGPLIETKAPEGDEGNPWLPVQPGDKNLPGLGLPNLRGEPPPSAEATQPAPAPKPAPKPGVFDRLFKRDRK